MIAYLHARRAMALSSHGNNMGEVQDALLFILCFGFSNLLHLDLDTFTMQESGRKWHAQALEAARKSRNLFPDFSDAILFEGIALVGMTKRADACDALEKVATLLNRMLEQLSDKSRQCFLQCICLVYKYACVLQPCHVTMPKILRVSNVQISSMGAALNAKWRCCSLSQRQRWKKIAFLKSLELLHVLQGMNRRIKVQGGIELMCRAGLWMPQNTIAKMIHFSSKVRIDNTNPWIAQAHIALFKMSRSSSSRPGLMQNKTLTEVLSLSFSEMNG